MGDLEGQIEFIYNNLSELPSILDNVKEVINEISLPIKTDSTYVMLTILLEICQKESKINTYFQSSESNAEMIEQIKELVLNFVHEESENIINYWKEFKLKKEETYLKLQKFEWKFIGLSTSENFDKGIIQPKILIRLTFNNGSEKIFESDYSTIKKLHEDVEECTSGFNSTYTRRIEHFAK